MNTVKFNHLFIQELNENRYCITLSDWVICIDASIDGEKIVSHWIENNPYLKIEDTYKSSVIEY